MKVARIQANREKHNERWVSMDQHQCSAERCDVTTNEC